jgi:fatty acid desaturase
MGMSIGFAIFFWKGRIMLMLWIFGGLLIAVPVLMSAFVWFLLLTYGATDEEVFDDGSWGQDIDQNAKRRYNSDT